jgi:hypothetical protein
LYSISQPFPFDKEAEEAFESIKLMAGKTRARCLGSEIIVVIGCLICTALVRVDALVLLAAQT